MSLDLRERPYPFWRAFPLKRALVNDTSVSKEGLNVPARRCYQAPHGAELIGMVT